MKLYVASSWKNDLYYPTLGLLREAGYTCLDWREDGGFSWSQIVHGGEETIKAQGGRFYRSVIRTHSKAIEGYASDWSKMQEADACILLLPCGRSAHLEAGWFVGKGKPLHIYIPVFDTPELMYKMAATISFDIEELIRKLDKCSLLTLHR